VADYVSVATGNASAGATWGQVDATSKLISNSSSTTALTTGNLDSATFAPGAITVIGMALRLGQITSLTAGQTITAILRNSTDSVDVATVVINKTALVWTATTVLAGQENGGWIFFKFAASQLLVAGKNYVVRLTCSNTSGSPTFYTNGTANNWQRMLVTTTAGPPAAGDDFHIMGAMDGSVNPVTAVTAVTVTWNITAATDFGSAQTWGNTYNTGARVPACSISNGGTLTWGTAAATNYTMRLSGGLRLYNGATLNMGTVATPCPRDSTMTLEFDCAADADFGFLANGTSVWTAQGQSRTSGKNVSKTLLTANAAGGATTLTVADDTGWLNGDAIGIAPTSQTATQGEENALTADAGASSLAVSALGASKLGTASDRTQGEVFLLTRNVQIRSVSSTAMAQGAIMAISNAGNFNPTIDWDWVGMRYFGTGSGVNGGALYIGPTFAGFTISFTHCIIRDSERDGWNLDSAVAAAIEWIDCAVWKWAVGGTNGAALRFQVTFRPTALISVTRLWACSLNAGSSTLNMGLEFASQAANIILTDVRVCGCAVGIRFDGIGSSSSQAMVAWSGLNIHSVVLSAIFIDNGGSFINMIFGGEIVVWHSAARGIYIDASAPGGMSLYFTGTVYCFGNATFGFGYTSALSLDLRFAYLFMAGTSTFAQAVGFDANTGNLSEVQIEQGSFGVASGIFVAHTTGDFRYNQTITAMVRWILRNCVLASATEIAGTDMSFMAFGSFIAQQRYDGTVAVHKTTVPKGVLAYETGTVQSSPGMKMSPALIKFNGTDAILGNAARLESNGGRVGRGFMVGVLSGNTVQVSVYVRKDGTYAGNQPRLVQKANGALGFNNDVVLATMTVGANTWEVLTGTTAAAADDGVVEFVVDCDGTAGNVYVNQWTSGSATPTGNEPTWVDGLPYKTAGASIPPSSGGTSRARVQRGM
jgi:hypothetical protein